MHTLDEKCETTEVSALKDLLSMLFKMFHVFAISHQPKYNSKTEIHAPYLNKIQNKNILKVKNIKTSYKYYLCFIYENHYYNLCPCLCHDCRI